MARVPNLAEILELMVYQGGEATENRRTLTGRRNFEVSVPPNRLRAVLQGVGLAVLGLLALGLSRALRAWRMRPDRDEA